MHVRDAKLALIVQALTPLVATGNLQDNASKVVQAIKKGTLPMLPVLIVVPGREEPQRAVQGTEIGVLNVLRRMAINITVIADTRAQLSATLASVEKAIPWTTVKGDVFDLGDTSHTDDDAGDRVIYLATLTISTRYECGLGQPDA